MRIGKGWVTYLFSYTMRDNDVWGGWVVVVVVGGLSPMTFWKSENLSNFKVHKLSWTVNELCTYLIIYEKKSSNIYKISKKLAKLNSLIEKKLCILLQSFTSFAIYATLHFSVVSSSKKQTHTHIQAKRQRKLETFNYNRNIQL